MASLSDHPEQGLVRARIGTDLAVMIEAGRHTLRADEPSTVGGGDSGPDPFGLLLASLAACVLMTLRMYASRKGWPMEAAEVVLTPTRQPARPLESVRIELLLTGPLDAEQRARLLEVASRCPVHRTLEHGARIETVFAGAERPPA